MDFSKYRRKRAASCESCEFFVYDEDAGCESCSLSLDEDEMVNFLQQNTSDCPYYRFYDEYKSVQRQI